MSNTVSGTSSPDVLPGTDEADHVPGGDGADTITAGRGYDLMTGGAGADVFVLNMGDGGSLPHDVITDFQLGTDTLVVPSGAALHTEDDAAGQWVHYGADRGNNDWVQLIGVHGATLEQLTGWSAPPPLATPTTGSDTLAGTAGADAIDALAGNDSVSGDDGADTITSGPGYDQMTGGPGADVFIFNTGDGGSLPHDVITDFQVGTDKLVLPPGAALHTEDAAAGQWVHYGADRGNNDWIQLTGVHGATVTQLTGSGGTPTSEPTTGNDTLVGTSGPDVINALGGDDVVSAGDGADTIFGSFGYDQLTGGAGTDVFAFFYGAGGSFPHDVVTDFEVGIDRLLLPLGAALHTEDDPAGQWVHYGVDLGNNDWVQLLDVHGATLFQLAGVGTSRDDTLTGNSGPELIEALAGNDRVNGGGGADTIYGGEGDDTLSGDDGDDRLYGGFGTDVLAGGGGTNAFVFGIILGFNPGPGAFSAGVVDTGLGEGARDIITDFAGASLPGGDVIDLSAINYFARRPPTDVAFDFIGQANFTGTSPQIRYEIRGNEYTLIQMDGVRTFSAPFGVTADGTPDAEIVVQGIHPFNAGDFLL